MAENKVEFEVEDDPPEIEIVDDTPESDRGRSAKGPVDVSDEENLSVLRQCPKAYQRPAPCLP
jgi:hypothetical protein